jgi:hypothetical protein
LKIFSKNILKNENIENLKLIYQDEPKINLFEKNINEHSVINNLNKKD